MQKSRGAFVITGDGEIARLSLRGRELLLPTQEMLQRFNEKEPLARATLKLKCSSSRKLGAVIYLGELPEPVEPCR